MVCMLCTLMFYDGFHVEWVCAQVQELVFHFLQFYDFTRYNFGWSTKPGGLGAHLSYVDPKSMGA